MKKLKEWQKCLIQNFEEYEKAKLTYPQIAIKCNAPNDDAVRHFVKRNKGYFEREQFNSRVELFTQKVDEHLAKSKVVFPKKEVKSPKILVFDIETSLLRTEANIFSLWQQNISIDELKGTGQYVMLSWAAKWLGEDNIMSDVVTSEEIIADNDKRVVKSIFKLLDEADITISHYGGKFDCPVLSARFMYHDLGLPSPYRNIDTCTTAKSAFKLPSYKLDALAKSFGFEMKDKMVKSDWIECLKGNTEYLTKMDVYCKKDVQLLEMIYYKLRPYIKHPNVGIYMDTDKHVCPACGSEDLKWGSKYHTDISAFEAFQCNDCGAHGRTRSSTISKEIKKNLTISIAK